MQQSCFTVIIFFTSKGLGKTDSLTSNMSCDCYMQECAIQLLLVFISADLLWLSFFCGILPLLVSRCSRYLFSFVSNYTKSQSQVHCVCHAISYSVAQCSIFSFSVIFNNKKIHQRASTIILALKNKALKMHQLQLVLHPPPKKSPWCCPCLCSNGFHTKQPANKQHDVEHYYHLSVT